QAIEAGSYVGRVALRRRSGELNLQARLVSPLRLTSADSGPIVPGTSLSESAVASPSAAALPNIWVVPGFREFMASMVMVTLANQIQGTVVAYQIYELTRDPLSLGAVGLAEALPFIAFALFGGHVGLFAAPVAFARRARRRAPQVRDLFGNRDLGRVSQLFAARARRVERRAAAAIALCESNRDSHQLLPAGDVRGPG